MHSKHRAIKSFIAEFTAILLYQFPVTFQGSVFLRFSVELIHNLNTDTVYSSTKMLHDMKAVEYNFCIRKKLFSKLIIGTKHIHGNHFDPISNLSRIAKKVVSDGCLGSSVENGDDI